MQSVQVRRHAWLLYLTEDGQGIILLFLLFLSLDFFGLQASRPPDLQTLFFSYSPYIPCAVACHTFVGPPVSPASCFITPSRRMSSSCGWKPKKKRVRLNHSPNPWVSRFRWASSQTVLQFRMFVRYISLLIPAVS